MGCALLTFICICICIYLFSYGGKLAECQSIKIISQCQREREVNWMGYISHVLSNKTVLDIYLPGTHDSGSYNLSRVIDPDHEKWLEDLIYDVEEYLPITDLYPFIKDWANSQNMSFLEQLNIGARYLDLRVAYDNTTNTFRAHHFLLSYFDLLVELKDIEQWVRNHTSEFVVLHLSHFVSMPDTAIHLKLTSYLASLFKGIIYSTKNVFNLNYAQMIKTNQRVIFFYQDIENYIPNSGIFFPTTMLLGDWVLQFIISCFSFTSFRLLILHSSSTSSS